MKIRTGFVSNSSSSSFVVLLPENFLETIDYEKITEGNEEFPIDDFKRLMDDFVRGGGIWEEEIYNYDEEGYEFGDILHDLIRPYVIADMDTSSDAGQIIIADRETVKKLI